MRLCSSELNEPQLCLTTSLSTHFWVMLRRHRKWDFQNDLTECGSLCKSWDQSPLSEQGKSSGKNSEFMMDRSLASSITLEMQARQAARESGDREL